MLSEEEVKQTIGMRWSQNFSKRYRLTSHELRANVGNYLQARNVSPYSLYEITRHSVPEMSEVVAGYVRPNIDELLDVIKCLERWKIIRRSKY